MKKIISITIIASLSIAGLLMTINQRTYECSIPLADVKGITQNISSNYSNRVEFNQEEIQLQKEVVQYKITFHHDDVIDVSLHMYVYYVDETMTSGYCLLTDGEKPLLHPRVLWYIPERKYSIITPRMRVSVGRFWLVKILNDKEGKLRFGSAYNDSGSFNVFEGDTWYLTLAVPTASEKSGYSVVFTSLNNSMEVNQLTRHSHLGLYAANYNQFSGKYYSIQLSLLGGFTACDISKEITVKNGSIIDIRIAAQRKGNMIVDLPNGEEIQLNKKGLIYYSFLGNETGSWKFTVKGWSIYFRMLVVLFYIDIDPHINPSSNTEEK